MLGFRVFCGLGVLGFRVLGCRVWSFWAEGLEFLGSRVWGLGFGVPTGALQSY